MISIWSDKKFCRVGMGYTKFTKFVHNNCCLKWISVVLKPAK